jgi:hypothetical protein
MVRRPLLWILIFLFQAGWLTPFEHGLGANASLVYSRGAWWVWQLRPQKAGR